MKTSTDTPSSATYDNEDTIRLNSSMITSSPIMGNTKYDHQVIQYQQQLSHQQQQQQQQHQLSLQHQHQYSQLQQQQLHFHSHYQTPNNLEHQRLSQFETNDQDLYQFENLGQFNPLPPPPISRNKAPSISSTFSSSNSYDLSPTAAVTNPLMNNHHENTAAHILQQNDEDFQSHTPHYSFFSQHNGASSVNSLPLQNHNVSHNSINNHNFHNNHNNSSNALFKLHMESTPDILSQNMSLNQSELMYNLTEFDVGNPSLDSIPDSIIYSNQNNTSMNSISNNNNPSNFINHNNILGNLNDTNAIPYSIAATNEISQFPYTPTLSDVYTPTLSDSSFTPNSTVNTNYAPQGSLDDHHLRAPTPHYATSVSNTNASNNKIVKKPSLSRLNNSIANKKNLIIQTHLASSTSNLSSSTPLSESSPKVSPLSNKYKGLENNHHNANQFHNSSTRSLSNYSTSSTTSTNNNSAGAYPPLNVFRHNSDTSSTASLKNGELTTTNNLITTPTTAVTTPRRKTYPSLNEISIKKSNKNLRKMTSKESIIMNDGSKNSSKESFTSHSSEDGFHDTPTGKTKKYTRRRLLPRSKNGCWICRIKHLKCDEVRPHCASCLKFGIACDYSDKKPDYVVDKELRLKKLDELSLIRKQNQVVSKTQKNKLKAGFNEQFQNFPPSHSSDSKSQYFS